MNVRMKMTTVIICASFALVSVFQNCSDVEFTTNDQGKLKSQNNNLAEEDLAPLVETAGVVTILLTLGDQLNDELVIQGGSSQLIAETMVRYASPKINPRILVVRDRKHNDESAYDTNFIADVLLKRFEAKAIDEPVGGVLPSHVQDYDLVWFNNPGHPMSSLQSKQTLLGFSGGVILSGDDMSRGVDFRMSDLTGLEYIDNGTHVICDGKSYPHDNNKANQYEVSIVSSKFPGTGNNLLNFRYGNDIDNSIASPNVEVIAYAKGGHKSCNELRPVVVRYEK